MAGCGWGIVSWPKRPKAFLVTVGEFAPSQAVRALQRTMITTDRQQKAPAEAKPRTP